MSPTVFRHGGYRFHFFSREERRLHVHVHHAEGEAKFWLEPGIELAQNYGLSPRRIAAALDLVRMNVRSALPGRSTSVVEVSNVSEHGFWLLVGETELFLPFEKFPWFRHVPVAHLLTVEMPHPTYLRWPKLDVGLAVESIEHPERFPLVSRVRPNNALQRTRARKAISKRRSRRRARR